MPQRPVDVEIRQSIKDIFLSKNEYRIVDDYVIQDGKRHPVAFLVPGGGYYMVSSFIEGTPIAKRLNEMGISVIIDTLPLWRIWRGRFEMLLIARTSICLIPGVIQSGAPPLADT